MILAPWGHGYEMDVQSVPDLLTVSEFNTMTGNRYAGQDVQSQINAAQDAIRDYCGWHIATNLKCTYTDDSLPRKRLIQLPALMVTGIESATVDGREVSFRFKPNGLARLDIPTYWDEWNAIEVTYNAGFTEVPAVIKDIIAHRAEHALAVPAGVQSETAGGVSISYAASWTSNNRATNLPADNLVRLNPYKVRRVL